ncbi:MAG TPA: hypothetical protein PKX93_00640 [bacterium]|nr:hypothetical protein [bacterium]
MKENCRWMERFLARKKDAPFPWWQGKILTRHLFTCPVCRRLLEEKFEEMLSQSVRQEKVLSESYWESYPARVENRIRKEKVLPGLPLRKQVLRFSLAVIVLGTVVYTGNLTYRLLRHQPLLKDWPVIKNLELIDELRADEEAVRELLQGIREPFPDLASPGVLLSRLREFRRLPASQQASILQNYEQWQAYSRSEKNLSRKIYWRLKELQHPAIDN